MKTPITYFLILLFLVSCKNDVGLSFEPIVIESESCTDCPEVTIKLPKAMTRTKLSKTVNTVLREEVISVLLFDEETALPTIQDAITSFNNGQRELQELHTDEATPWEAKIDAQIAYEDKSVLTIALDIYLFTGGAHGYTSKRFLNFDKKRGVELENRQLFTSSHDFQLFAEKKFSFL